MCTVLGIREYKDEESSLFLKQDFIFFRKHFDKHKN